MDGWEVYWEGKDERMVQKVRGGNAGDGKGTDASCAKCKNGVQK